MGLLNIITPVAYKCPRSNRRQRLREWSKKSVQQGRSLFGARSVLSVREHGKLARTLLAALFNIPTMYQQLRVLGCKGEARVRWVSAGKIWCAPDTNWTCGPRLRTTLGQSSDFEILLSASF